MISTCMSRVLTQVLRPTQTHPCSDSKAYRQTANDPFSLGRGHRRTGAPPHPLVLTRGPCEIAANLQLEKETVLQVLSCGIVQNMVE